MKTATLPPIRVEPELRDKLESVLRPDESITSFVEASLRSAIEYRRTQSEFLARGQRSKERLAATGVSFSTDEVFDRQLQKIQSRRDQVLGKGK